MPDYSKLKNAELEALLKERGLPHTGKKAEMVSRLQEHDKKDEPATVATANEDEIDWDDDAAPAENAPAPTATDSKVEGNKTAAVPNQVAAIDPSTTSDVAVNSSTETAANGEEKVAEELAAEKPDFSAGLATTDLEAEIAKRKARAEKFGIKEGEEDPDALEAIKKLERAKKFNETDGAINKLDTALPERRENKRRRDGGDERGDYKRRGGRGGRNFGGRRGGDGGPRRDGGDRRREPREERSGGGGGSGGNWMNESDRKAAEARKGRWA